MKNMEIAQILEEIADLLEIQGIPYKPIAYRRAAETLKSLSEPTEDLNQKKLNELPGIGKHIAGKIDELNKTGHLVYFEDLKKECPIDFESLLAVEGIGPKTVKLLYQSLKIKNLDELEEQAKHHRIRKLKGMSEKKEANMLENIKFARKTSRKLLGQMLPLANEIKNNLKKLDKVLDVEVAGSIRRRKETIGDIDILVITDDPQEIMEYFINMDNVERVIATGPTKSTVKLIENVSCDLREVPAKSFGSALLYFTGSKEVNVELRKLAIRNGWKLSEYGLFKDNKIIAGKTEEEIFRKFKMKYMEPEIRETSEDVESALQGRLPHLIGYSDLKGDLQMHTKCSDGKSTIKDMANYAFSLGHEYIAITDHTAGLSLTGMDEEKIKIQMKEIDNLNEKIEGITIFKGLEVDIDSRGKLDVKDDILKELDVVIASIHSGFRQSKEQLTMRIIAAMENEYVNIIAHPTGRKIQQRDEYDLDMDRIFQTSVETDTYLEVNSQPIRLDLRDVHIRKALKFGCKLVINTDAHTKEHLNDIQYGIATVRRGWAEKENIINTRSLKAILRYFNS
ncbi:MAG: DNA polymerase/3'-5' exonuclease PolX [Methanobacterium sp.]|nr:DNA polymerase/3'-5' exonuclease PolX [Methanobacterium sp.]